MMNDASDNWLFAFNCAVPNLRSSTLSLNDSNQFFRPILCQISNFKFQKTTVVVAGSRYRVDGVGLGYVQEIRGNMVGFPAGKRRLSSNASSSNVVPPSLQWVSRAVSLGVSAWGVGLTTCPF